MNTAEKQAKFIENIETSVALIRRRIEYREGRKFLPNLIRSEISPDGFLWLTFGDGKVSHSITIPTPVDNEKGNTFINLESVKRAVGSWMIDENEYSFWGFIEYLFIEPTEKILARGSKRSYVERLLRSFEYNSAAIVFSGLQRIIDEQVNALPLAGTDVQNWAMCNRVQIVSKEFNSMTPKQALAYQKEMNEKLFPWTSLGLSDSGMCNNNILKIDVRKTIPYGMSHHNPRRNLYQTLGMKGDEIPTLMSRTERGLANKGIVRKGWNLMTAFIDTPLNFEDQIIVSDRLKNLFVEDRKSFNSFGMVIVGRGDGVKFLSPLSIEPDGTIQRFDLHTDGAVVESVEEVEINFDGGKKVVNQITIKFRRKFKDGFKLTNRHGNKGIITMKDTGYVEDPVRGKIPVDIIVSAKSVQKRKNFGQLLEALTTLLRGDEELTIEDDYVAHIDSIKTKLKNAGYNEDGTLKVKTQWGEFQAVAGWIHWGCIKTPEDQLWSYRDTRLTNNKDLRVAGNKISHIEMKGLITIFGPKNPIVEEILQYRQGEKHIEDYLDIIETMRGNFKPLPEVRWDRANHIDQRAGFFHNVADFTGTMADESFFPEGFYLELPKPYVVRRNGYRDFDEGLKKEEENLENCVIIKKIMVPPAEHRRPWKHQSGKYGLSEVSVLLNNLVGAINRVVSGDEEEIQMGKAIYTYFHTISKNLSSKTGLISNYAMAVRYPWTIKGTASVSEELAPNEIEIHEDLARSIRVKDGDLVIVERFPCLGFMSLRTQKVKLTRDEQCRYVIRVSGNSLASLNLDFDGDVIYVMSFKSPQAIDALEKEFANPHPDRVAAYTRMSERKIPCYNEMKLDDYDIEIFPELTSEQNAQIVEGLTGIKRGTGTIIALCYNLMRILEANVGYNDPKMAIAMECLLDKVANSVFSQKHAGKSLEDECREAICCADVNKMIALDFGEAASHRLAEIIKQKASDCGFKTSSLANYYYNKTEKEGRSSIVNIIVRKFHKIWFASRSNLFPVLMLENLEAEPNDLPSHLYKKARENAKKRVFRSR